MGRGRYYKRMGAMPNMNQAGTYSAVLHYLKAVEASGSDTTTAVVDQMKKMKPSDMFSRGGYIRPTGCTSTTCTWSRSSRCRRRKSPGTFYDIVAKIPGDQALVRRTRQNARWSRMPNSPDGRRRSIE